MATLMEEIIHQQVIHLEELENPEENIQVMREDAAKEIKHGICVSNLAFRMAEVLDFEQGRCHEMAQAGLLHDIGKLRLSRYLYGRGGDTLRIEEMKYVRTHSKLSYEIVKEQGYSDFIMESILYHHENYDGSGYPFHTAGEEIPHGARVLRVCDVFAALTSDRAYRKAFDIETAVSLMIDEVNNFDMEIFLAFLNVIHEDGAKTRYSQSVLDQVILSI